MLQRQEYHANYYSLHETYNTGLRPRRRVPLERVLDQVLALAYLEARFENILIDSIHDSTLLDNKFWHLFVKLG